MSDLAETKFAQAFTILESLKSAYNSASDDSEKNRIKEAMNKVVGEIPDEYLTAFGFYADERVRRAESAVADAHNILGQLEAERERRRPKI